MAWLSSIADSISLAQFFVRCSHSVSKLRYLSMVGSQRRWNLFMVW